MSANVHRILSAALLRMAPGSTIASSRERPWASVTFSGARHWIALEIEREGSAAFAAMLPEAEFSLSGHLVADLAVMACEPQGDRALLHIEALTVEAH